MAADRSHIHHRLLDLGLGHKVSVLVVYCCSYCMAAVAVTFYSAPDSSLLLFLATGTALFYPTLYAASRWLAPRYAILTSNQAVLGPGWYSVLDRQAGNLLKLAKYLIVVILASSTMVNLPVHPASAVIAGLLLCGLFVAYLVKQPWGNQMLQVCIYLSGAFLIFQIDNYARSATVAGLPLRLITAALFVVLLLVVSLKIFIRKRLEIMMSTAFEYTLFMAAIFIPLMSKDIVARYHLLTVAGKSIILFVAYKLILVREDSRRNKTIIYACFLTLLYFIVNRLS